MEVQRPLTGDQADTNSFTANNSLPVKEQESKLTSEFENWKGKPEQVDDVCLIGIRL